MRLTDSQIKEFQDIIFTWWRTHRRDLPWRKTHDPYKILVSEIMLQQTQVSRALPKFEEFLSLFPTVQALSHASTSDVLKAWKGMGYNRRALYLKKTAEAVVNEYGGVFPKDEAKLLKLPGLGKYTTRALLVFAYKSDVSMVDTNIRQIIVHFFFNDVPQKEKEVEEVADQLVPKGYSWDWHQALMDYGALELVRSKPRGKKQGTKKIPFKDTKRFIRGRIMDILRDESLSENKLLDSFQDEYKKPKEFIQSIIDDLIRDGLIVREYSRLRLPD